MALPLKESRAISDIAELLYDFLPGSGRSTWKGHVSFKTVAEEVGVGDFWQPGSKIPMIIALLERTLEFRRGRFEPLIVEIVRRGIIYRQRSGKPIQPEEIEKLNGLIREIGFKFPDLWDPSLLASLRSDSDIRAREQVERAQVEEKIQATTRSQRSTDLEELKNEFYRLHGEEDRQKAGRALEKILCRLFILHDLQPRESFRVDGEEIDGSFELDHEIYLLEAKWEQDPSPEKDLLVFRGKIEGKSKFTRGVFLAINGITKEAQAAIAHGKELCFFVIDGYDLTMLLEDNIDLKEFLRRRQRLLAEQGRVVVPFKQLF